jgi:hypothetical protein
MMRFRQRLKDRGWAGVWRVELQRRKVPHLHVALYLAEGYCFGDVLIQWCEATGEIHDMEALKHAVKGKRIEDEGWVVYMALHDGKKKEAQLGWQGKQWGVWNQDAFVERTPSNYSRELTPGMNAALRRFLRRWLSADRRFKAALHRYRSTLPHLAIEERFRHRETARVLSKPFHLHNGNLLRCLDGKQVDRILAAMDDGRISHVSHVSHVSSSRPLAGPQEVYVDAQDLKVGGVVVAHCELRSWRTVVP